MYTYLSFHWFFVVLWNVYLVFLVACFTILQILGVSWEIGVFRIQVNWLQVSSLRQLQEGEVTGKTKIILDDWNCQHHHQPQERADGLKDKWTPVIIALFICLCNEASIQKPKELHLEEFHIAQQWEFSKLVYSGRERKLHILSAIPASLPSGYSPLSCGSIGKWFQNSVFDPYVIYSQLSKAQVQ